MTSRAEVTSRYAKAYVKASKKDKGRVLDAVVEVTGWSRDNARRRLVAADVALCGAVGGEAGGDQLAGRVVSRGVSIRLGPAVAGRWQPAGTRLASVRLGGEGRGSGLVSAARRWCRDRRPERWAEPPVTGLMRRRACSSAHRARRPATTAAARSSARRRQSASRRIGSRTAAPGRWRAPRPRRRASAT